MSIFADGGFTNEWAQDALYDWFVGGGDRSSDIMDMILYIQEQIPRNHNRTEFNQLPVGFEGFFYSENNLGTTHYWGFVNLNESDNAGFYKVMKGGQSSPNLKYASEMFGEITRVKKWGREGHTKGWNIPHFWDITPLVLDWISGIKYGFINWPLDPPRIGDGV